MIEMHPVSSSMLAAVGYDAEAKVLHTAYKNGSRYQYAGVPAHKFEGLMKSGSKGNYFNTHIKPHHKVSSGRPITQRSS